jgi:hypothetical protein
MMHQPGGWGTRPRPPGLTRSRTMSSATQAGGGDRLELVRDPSGLRHYLAGKPVHAGYGLELQLEGGVWIGGRYEWNFQGEKPPLFYFGLADVAEELVIALPSMALLRWPSER